MTNLKYQNQKFKHKGIPIPKFDMKFGRLIRLCVPNFDSKGNSLVHSFRYGLLSHFEEVIPGAKWSKRYKESLFRRYIKPLTVENYISKKLSMDSTNSKIIWEYLELDPKEKLNNLTTGKSKALAIKCDFKKYDTLIFDYYGVSANEIDFLDRVVDEEIQKEKCGIAIDRLEFNQNNEVNKNVEQIKVTVGNNIYVP
ncbi:hypothetical protein GCM10009430_49360 [Aquimarina litoralis]|uniref:Uncharacterized protein n=1 Tax=Aquimarina litoralis TaxID=584605 RepID=A0ABN1JB28_9FLAO